MTLQQETITAVLTFKKWENSDRSFCVYEFKNKDTNKTFVAVGADLPQQRNVPVNLVGSWEVNKKTGKMQFKVAYAERGDPNKSEEIIAFLTSLGIGIGKTRAARICRRFKGEAWKIIEEHPEQLTEVSGITEQHVEKLREIMKQRPVSKDFIRLFSQMGITQDGDTIHQIIKAFGDNSYQILIKNPYIACGIGSYSLTDAEIIAKNLGIPKDNENRLKAIADILLLKASTSGHVCVPYQSFIKEYVKRAEVEEEKCTRSLKDRIHNHELCFGNGCIYSAKNFREEGSIAKDLVRLLNSNNRPISHVDAFIDDYEKSNFVLADCQREAVKSVFQQNVSIITGGPGVGKTTVTKAILATHLGIFGNSSEPVLLAPTGKAAMRMAEATGYPANTIHSAIGWKGDSIPVSDDPLEGNLFLIDESSMMDQYIASLLLSKIKTGSRVVFIGDVDQLPSVGCGNVLKDMIMSKCIPTTRLNVIYRQAKDNPIVVNSHKINEGKTDLVFDKNFMFIQTQNEKEIVDCACTMYERAVKKCGIDNVILLNPQRNKTDVSVSTFNKILQERINPHKDGDPEIAMGWVTFRKGDKVIELKNTQIAKNGDTGFIIDIIKRADNNECPNEFNLFAIIKWNGYDNVVEYSVTDLKHVDLAYCTTVHKSQGSEYEVVIQIVSRCHDAMLKRNTIYTGFTRAKKTLVAIGEVEALNKGIGTIDNSIRFTNLAHRIYALSKKENV